LLYTFQSLFDLIDEQKICRASWQKQADYIVLACNGILSWSKLHILAVESSLERMEAATQ